MAAAIALSACATGYHADNFNGGYSEAHLRDNVYQVAFDGSRFTSLQRARDFARLRAAELTLEKGYRYFGLLDSKAYLRNYSAGSADIYVDIDHSIWSLFAFLVTIPLLTVDMPFSSLTVMLLHEIPQTGPTGKLLDARKVYDDITGRYRLRNRFAN